MGGEDVVLPKVPSVLADEVGGTRSLSHSESDLTSCNSCDMSLPGCHSERRRVN
jgi:hypothetical protein